VTKGSQPANSENLKRDEVLKRMLKMKPHPHNKNPKNLEDRHKTLADSENVKPSFTGSKESTSDISDGNYES
jgi:hypothetical protein